MQMRGRGGACATCSANPATKSPAPAANELRDDAPWPVPYRQTQPALAGAPRPGTCRAEGSLRWRTPGAPPFPRRVPGRVAVCGKKKGNDGVIAASSQSFRLSFVLHREHATHYAGKSLPVGGVFRKLLAALLGQ